MYARFAEADRLQEKLLKKMNVFEIDTRSQEIELVPEQGEYWYGIMYRPFSPGAQPMEGFWYRLPAYERNAVDPGHCFYDILVYHNELDAKAVRDYELVRILG